MVAGAYDGNRCGTGATVGGTTTGAMTGGDGKLSAFGGGTSGTDVLGFAAGAATKTGRAVGAVVVEAATGPVVTGPASSLGVVVEGTAAATGDSDNDGAAGAPVPSATGDVSDGAAGSAGQAHNERKAAARRNVSSQNSAGIWPLAPKNSKKEHLICVNPGGTWAANSAGIGITASGSPAVKPGGQ